MSIGFYTTNPYVAAQLEQLRAVEYALSRGEPVANARKYLTPSHAAPAETQPDKPQTQILLERGRAMWRAKIYPALGLALEEAGLLRGYQLWSLARLLDHRGSGLVTEKALQGFCRSLKLSPANYKRAMAAAVHGGFVVLADGRAGRIVILKSLEQVARRAGVSHAGVYPVLVDAGAVVSLPKFKAAIYAAWLAGRAGGQRDKPISRDTLQTVTGISKTTQRRYEKHAGVKAHKQFGKIRTTGADDKTVAALREHGAPVFSITHKGKSIGLMRRLPNVYSSPYEQAKRGSLRQINSRLSAVSFKCRGATGTTERIYCNDDNQAKRVLIRAGELCSQPKPRFVRTRYTTRAGVPVWRSVG